MRQALHWRMQLARLASQTTDPFGHTVPFLRWFNDAPAATRLLQLRRVGRVIAFSRRDELSAGFGSARAAAETLGYAATVRSVGGTFAPLHEGSLIVDHYVREEASGVRERHVARFEENSVVLRDVFASLGIDARVGAVAREYCPGSFSINARGMKKLSGTAQRVSRHAWLVSSVIQVGDAQPLRAVTAACATALVQDVDADVTGSIEAETGVSDVGVVARTIARSFCERGLVSRVGTLGATLA